MYSETTQACPNDSYETTSEYENQARNRLGTRTPEGAKCFLRGAKFFKLCPTNFSKEGEKFSRGAKPLPPRLVTDLMKIEAK